MNGPAQRSRRPAWLFIALIVVAAGAIALLGWLPTVQHNYDERLIEGGAQTVIATVAFGLICCVVALGAFAGRSGTGGVFLLLVGLGFCGFGFYQGYDTVQDVLSGPATVHGQVTMRYTTSSGRHGQVDDHHLTVGGIAFRNVADDLYSQALMGQCVVVTYGPHTDIATAVTDCK